MPVNTRNNTSPVYVPTFEEGSGLPQYDSQTETPAYTEAQSGLWDIPFYDTWVGFFNIALVITLIFLAASVYAAVRIRQIRKVEQERMDAEPPGLAMSMFLEGAPSDTATSLGFNNQVRWNQIMQHARSQNQNDWRLAIIEADILLDALATERGYSGETLGEKLKQVNRESWNTIDAAWEAHKARNKIAHEGAAHELTERETRRIIGLYEQVFREFGYIS
jgi:hypothetical protein